jgi:hypothetical protein
VEWVSRRGLCWQLTPVRAGRAHLAIVDVCMGGPRVFIDVSVSDTARIAIDGTNMVCIMQTI